MVVMKFTCLAVVVVLTSLAVIVIGQVPCCMSNIYSVRIAQGVHDDSSAEGDIHFQEGMYYFDGHNNRTAFNLTNTPLLVNQSSLQLYIIQDYKQKFQYVVIDNKQCSKTPLDNPFPSNCIPAKSTYIGTPNMGQKLPVYRWSIMYGQALHVAQEFTVTTDTCAPVTSFFLKSNSTTDLHTAIASEYFDFKASIDDLNQKFTPPGYCPKDMSASNTQIPKRVEDIIRRFSVSKPFVL